MSEKQYFPPERRNPKYENKSPIEIVANSELSVTCGTDIGQRTENQDRFITSKLGDLAIYGVCGGAQKADVAQYLSDSFVDVFNSQLLLYPNNIGTALVNSFIEIQRRLLYPPDLREDRGYGSTATIVILDSKNIYIAHVGDSIAVLEDKNGELDQITVAEVDKKRNRLSKAFTVPKKDTSLSDDLVIEQATPTILTFPRANIRRVFLCTDGLIDWEAKEAQNVNIVIKNGLKASDPESQITRMITYAEEKGSRDNKTMMIIDIASETNDDSEEFVTEF